MLIMVWWWLMMVDDSLLMNDECWWMMVDDASQRTERFLMVSPRQTVKACPCPTRLTARFAQTRLKVLFWSVFFTDGDGHENHLPFSPRPAGPDGGLAGLQFNNRWSQHGLCCNDMYGFSTSSMWRIQSGGRLEQHVRKIHGICWVRCSGGMLWLGRRWQNRIRCYWRPGW